MWGDRDNPRFVDVTGRTSGGAGTTPTPSTKSRRSSPTAPTASPATAATRYLSITVYGGPDDGHYSNRIVGTLNDRSLEFDADGNFEFTISPDPQPGAWRNWSPTRWSR